MVVTEQEAAVVNSPLPVPIQSPGKEPSSLDQNSLAKLSVDGHISDDAQTTLPMAKTPVATPAMALPPASQQVVEQLLLEADTAKAKGQPEIAIMKLQQAQRIAPQEPKVYARLAALYLLEGQALRAEQLARKGLTLVAKQPAYGDFFWRLIAASRRYQGDAQGEQEALARVKQLPR
jgi:predicted Zn-dependent protease